MKMPLRFVPFVALLLCVAALGIGLFKTQMEQSSKLIGKAPDAFSLPLLSDAGYRLDSTSLSGTVVLLNVFASWCEPCRIEHPLLMELARAQKVEMIGIAWKDTPEKISAWLKEHGNPYDRVAIDEKGVSTLPLALYGVPEMFVFDKGGIVRYHHRAPVTPEELEQEILPLIEELHARDR